MGDHNSIAMNLGNLGLVAFAQGEFERAFARHEEALALWPLLTNKSWLARAIENFALTAAAMGQGERAARLFGAAAAWRATLGVALPPNDLGVHQKYVGAVSDVLGDDAFSRAWDEGEALSHDQAIDYALRYDPPRLLPQRRSA